MTTKRKCARAVFSNPSISGMISIIKNGYKNLETNVLLPNNRISRQLVKILVHHNFAASFVIKRNPRMYLDFLHECSDDPEVEMWDDMLIQHNNAHFCNDNEIVECELSYPFKAKIEYDDYGYPMDYLPAAPLHSSYNPHVNDDYSYQNPIMPLWIRYYIDLRLLYINNLPSIHNIIMTSTPGSVHSMNVLDLTNYIYRKGQSLLIVHTCDGLMTGQLARAFRLGGQLVCIIN